jgi:DNA ligase-1
MNRYFISVLLALSLLPHSAPALAAEPPPLMLANTFRPEVHLSDYLISEKLDGVRGYWNGKRLLTRGGFEIHAPAWFVAGWPDQALDGELWAGHGRFAQAVSIVRSMQPDEAEWRRMRFMVFDLPAHPGSFAQRDAELGRMVAALQLPWLVHVEQFEVSGLAELRGMLARIVRQGGEGLMLHRRAASYRAERSDDLLKLKPFEDAEAQVVAHLPGKGKYAGMLGALEVATAAGLRFRLGSGLSEAERRNPPPLGSWVSYRYNGVNENTGVPRFAHFLRVCEEVPVALPVP